MKKIIYLFLLLGVVNSEAQTNADCINAIPLCNTPSFTFFATSGNGSVNDIPTGNNISNPSTNPFSTNAGCLLSGENVPQWLLITIGNSGNLEFVFGAGNSSNPQVGFYDWAMWPYNPNACAGIMNNTLPPIRCNWNATSSGGTGIASAANIPPGGNAGNYEPPLAVNACQQFIICISNFSGVNTLVSFQSLGTASLSCNPSCNPNYSICAGSAATIVPVNFNALSNPTFSLQPGGASNTTGSFVVTPSVTTTYTTYITGLNSNNAVQTTTAISNVTVQPLPVFAPTFTQQTCANSFNAVNLGLSFNPFTPVPNYTVAWNPVPPSVTSPTQTYASNLNPGTTNVTVTAAGGCASSVSFSMSLAVAPTLTLTNLSGSYSITCNTPSINMSAASSYTNGTLNYIWSSVSFTANTQTVSIAQTGTYNVCVTDPVTACSACDTFMIFQNLTAPSSSVNPISQNITCLSGAATFTGTALSPTVNIVHEWYCPSNPPPAGPPSFVSNNTISLFSAQCGPGTYTYILKDQTNGCITTKTIEVTSASGFPSFLTTSTTNYSVGCSPSSMTLCITSVSSAINGPTNYLFLPPGTPSAIPAPTTAFSSNACTVTGVPGTWTLVVQDITNGCQTALPLFIIQNTVAPHVAYAMTPNSQTLTCFNPTLYAAGSSTTANTVVSWIIPSNPPALASPTLIVGPPTGPGISTSLLTYTNYYVIATNTVNGCKSTQTVVINQNFKQPVPILSVGNPSVLGCKNTPVELIYSNFTGGSGIPGAVASTVPYGWYGPSPQTNISGPSTYSAYIKGDYTLTVQDTKNGCIGSAVKTVEYIPNYPVLLNAANTVTMDCSAISTQSASMQIALSQSVALWSILIRDYPVNATFGPNAAIGSSVTNAPNGLTSSGLYISQVITTDQLGVYSYIVTNNISGCKSIGTINVVPGALAANFAADPATGYAPLTVNFTNNSASSTGAGSITSVWNFGNGSSQTTTTNIGTSGLYTAPGTYTVVLYASKGTCADTAYQVIKVEIPSKLEVPNVFTPNGDGSNDLFFLKTQNLTEITTVIFDRWGNKVYDVSSTTGNIGWDGKNADGKDCPAGTYFYIIKATGKDGTAYDQKGNVSMYR